MRAITYSRKPQGFNEKMPNPVISQLQPQALWASFAKLNEVPRASKKETRVTQFAVDFGKSLGLETLVDSTGNVLIRKPASKGRENDPGVVLQAHLDMVHQKNANTQFDFDSEGIRMLVEGDWVRADGTTLGADNGIGVAAIMAILQSSDISHPPLEALFTIDEETGMTGAKALKPDWVQGRVLLNLDTEEDNELTIGCAGGVDVTGTLELKRVATPTDHVGLQIEVSGLTGGHSGMDIHLGRGNANKLMNRLLWQLESKFNIHLHSIDGGSLRNAIPRESTAVLSAKANDVERIKEWIVAEASVLASEYSVTDPGLKVTCNAVNAPTDVIDKAQQTAILNATYALHNGIFRMSPNVEGLVQTSNNLAKVHTSDTELTWACLTRSSVDTERDELARMLSATMQLTGATVEFAGDYPGWQPAPQSNIVELMSKLYESMFDGQPHVAACHAGLECGIIGAHYPGMEMISFGPNIRGAHSPDEQVQISSVEKFWKFLIRTLSEIK
ncbi:MAG: aminoacyl-histidine dipeptidase [Pirellulaceae bacterium]